MPLAHRTKYFPVPVLALNNLVKYFAFTSMSPFPTVQRDIMVLEMSYFLLYFRRVPSRSSGAWSGFSWTSLYEEGADDGDGDHANAGREDAESSLSWADEVRNCTSTLTLYRTLCKVLGMFCKVKEWNIIVFLVHFRRWSVRPLRGWPRCFGRLTMSCTKTGLLRRHHHHRGLQPLPGYPRCLKPSRKSAPSGGQNFHT